MYSSDLCRPRAGARVFPIFLPSERCSSLVATFFHFIVTINEVVPSVHARRMQSFPLPPSPVWMEPSPRKTSTSFSLERIRLPDHLSGTIDLPVVLSSPYPPQSLVKPLGTAESTFFKKCHSSPFLRCIGHPPIAAPSEDLSPPL